MCPLLSYALIGVISRELFDALPRRHLGMTIVTSLGGFLITLSGSERVGDIPAGDDEH